MGERYVKVTVNVAPDLYDDLRSRAAERGLTVSELLRRAVGLYKFMLHDNPDAEVLIKRGDDVRRVVFL